MDTLRQDLRYAFRSLAKAPGFTLVTLLTLALGIGANTAIFSVVNAVLLRALPVRDPGELFVIRETYSGGEIGSVSGPNFLDWKTRNQSFAEITAWRRNNLGLVGQGEPEEIRGALVDADFFKVLGVEPILGRGFLPGEDQGQATVVLIGETLWRTRFGADPQILGRTISLSGQSYTVIGVTPASMTYPAPVLAWLPLGYGQGRSSSRDSHSYDVIGRLKPGMTAEQAQADLTTIARALEAAYPASNAGRGVTIIPLTDDSVGTVRTALLLLTGAVTLVLLIVCANVANLFLARAATRQRELAVRSALGAGRWRLTRQVLVEAVTLSVVGGLLGLLLASWADRPAARHATARHSTPDGSEHRRGGTGVHPAGVDRGRHRFRVSAGLVDVPAGSGGVVSRRRAGDQQWTAADPIPLRTGRGSSLAWRSCCWWARPC